MKRFGNYEYGILLIGIIALLHQYLQKQLHWQFPYLHAYLDDVLCIPLFLALWRWERRYFWQVPRIAGREVSFFVIFVFVLFEGVIPRFTTSFTADWWDGVAYGLGGVLFWWLQSSIIRTTAPLDDGGSAQ